jgi:hypothetical protein
MNRLILLAVGAAIVGLSLLWGAGAADAAPDCAFADNVTPTECQITTAWTSATIPPALPGPYVFNKTLDASATGGPGIDITITGANEVGGIGGALIMDAGASVIDTNDVAGNNQPAGHITINATGAGLLAAGSMIRSENNTGNGGAGDISLTFGKTSSFAGTISSRETSGADQTRAGNITVNVTGDLTLTKAALVTSQKNSDSSKSGDIAFNVSGNMTMEGDGSVGAIITAAHPGATNGTPGGDITIKVGTGDQGVFTMQPATLIDSGGRRPRRPDLPAGHPRPRRTHLPDLRLPHQHRGHSLFAGTRPGGRPRPPRRLPGPPRTHGPRRVHRLRPPAFDAKLLRQRQRRRPRRGPP